jgi:hypothetical protein
MAKSFGLVKRQVLILFVFSLLVSVAAIVHEPRHQGSSAVYLL